MPVVPNCHNCGSPLSKTSLEAFVPTCGSCGTPVMGLGGVLGMTSAFARDDPSLNRTLIERELDVYRDHVSKYNGLILVSRQELLRGPAFYATLPPPPELLAVQPVPSIADSVTRGLKTGCTAGPGTALGLLVATCAFAPAIKRTLGPVEVTGPFAVRGVPLFDELFWISLIALALCWPIAIGMNLLARLNIGIANGAKPAENARRQRAHDEATATALKKAQSLKDAEDHGLRRKIAEAEGRLAMAQKGEQELQRLLARLP